MHHIRLVENVEPVDREGEADAGGGSKFLLETDIHCEDVVDPEVVGIGHDGDGTRDAIFRTPELGVVRQRISLAAV